MFRFIHCADLHLDSPLRGLSSRTDAPIEEVRGATRKALTHLVDFAIEEAIDFVVIAGDVYDGNWEDYSTGLFFSRAMARLREHGIPVYLIHGNHDAVNVITRDLVLPDNVTRLSADRPETVMLEDLRVAIHGQSFATSAVTEDLSLRYPEPIAGYYNIGLLHTSADGREGHEAYAPCRMETLIRKGYDYWALGHIHMREVLHESPYIVFPGNIQGRHIRETGAKGCTVVTVEGSHTSIAHHDMDVFRFERCEVDVTGVTTIGEFSNALCESLERVVAMHRGFSLAVRVRIFGVTSLHGDIAGDTARFVSEVRSAAGIVSPSGMWVEKVRFETRAPSQSQDAGHLLDAVASLRTTVDTAATDAEFLQQVAQQLSQWQLTLREYVRQDDALCISSGEDIRGLLEDARDLLLATLQNGGIAG